MCRNSLHVTPPMNSCGMGVNIKPVKLYIRFWEYSNGVGGFPGWCVILVHCNFAKKQEQELQEVVRFFKEYAPRYGYKYIGIGDITAHPSAGIQTYSANQRIGQNRELESSAPATSFISERHDVQLLRVIEAFKQ